MSNYELRLAQSMTDLFAANKELDKLRKEKESDNAEIENLKWHVKQLECEVFQFRGLKLRNEAENIKIKQLEKEILIKLKSIRRFKKSSVTYRSQIAKKDTQLKRMECYNEQIECLLREFGKKLTEAGLLTKKFRVDLAKKYGKAFVSIESSETIGNISEGTSEVFNSSLKLTNKIESDNAHTCIGDDQNVFSVRSPTSSLTSSSEIIKSDCANMDIFQTEFQNLPKKKNKFKKKFLDNNNTEEDQNRNLYNSPGSSNFDESTSQDKGEIELNTPTKLCNSYVNNEKNFCKVEDHSVFSNINEPLSKIYEQIFTDSQSVTEVIPYPDTSPIDMALSIPALGNSHISDNSNMPEGCQLANTLSSKQDLHSLKTSQEIISMEKCKNLNTFQNELHTPSKRANKYKKKVSYNNIAEDDEIWNLCSSPDSSDSDKEIDLYDEKEKMNILSPLHDSYVEDTKNSQVFEETNELKNVPKGNQLKNNSLFKQDSFSIQPIQEVISTQKQKNLNICDPSDINQKICDLKSSKNSTDPIVINNKSQTNAANSDSESDFLEVEDMQRDSCSESGKNSPKTINASSATLLEVLPIKSVMENFDSLCTNISTDNQNINLSSLASSQTANEILSSNNISNMSSQNDIIDNLSNKQEKTQKKLLVSNFADDAEQDLFSEHLPKTSEIDTRSPHKGKSLGNDQNPCVNREENSFRTVDVSCGNILTNVSSSKNLKHEGKINVCSEQAFSINISSEKNCISDISMPLWGDLSDEKLNHRTTSEYVLKNDVLLKQSPKTELKMLAVNEDNTFDVLKQRSVLTNEISSLTDNFSVIPKFVKATSVSQDDKCLSGDSGYDEYSKFGKLSIMLLNPTLPLSASQSKNRKFFHDKSISNSSLKELKKNEQTNQISSIPKSVKDQELPIDKDKNFSVAKSILLSGNTNISHKNDNYFIESNDNLDKDIQPKLVEQHNSLYENIIKPAVSENQELTKDAVCLRPCFVSLSRCDVPRYFSSKRKQTQSKSEMLTIHKNSYESFIPESSNLIASSETDNLLLIDSNNKAAINDNNILKFDPYQYKIERENSISSQECFGNKSKCKLQSDTLIKRPFIDCVTTSQSSLLSKDASPNSLTQDSPVVAILDHKLSCISAADLTESENSLTSSHNCESTLKVSASNSVKSSSDHKNILNKTFVNIQNPYVLLSKNDIRNYFHSLKNKFSFQASDSNQINSDSLNSRVCGFEKLCSNKQIEKLEAHDNLSNSFTTNCKAMSDSACCQNEFAGIKTSLKTATFSNNKLNIKSNHEISSEKTFGILNVKNIALPFSSLILTKSLDPFKQQSTNDTNNNAVFCTNDYNVFSESESCCESSSSKFITDGAHSFNMIESSASRKQNISNWISTSKIRTCYVLLSRNDIPNYFRNLRNKTPSQLVDYYNSRLSSSEPATSRPVISFEKEENDFLLCGNSTTTHMKCLTNLDSNMQHETEKISNLSASEILFEKESNSEFSCDGSLEETSNLSKTKITAPSLSSQSFPLSNNSTEDSSLNITHDLSSLVENISLKEHENCESSNGLGNISIKDSVSSVSTTSAKEKEISSKTLSGCKNECFVSLSRSEIPNYFLSLRKKSVLQATEHNQTNFINLKTNVCSSVIVNESEPIDNTVLNDNNTTFKDCERSIEYDSIHLKIKKVGINMFSIPSNKKHEPNSCFLQEILSDKSYNLLREQTFVLPIEKEKLTSSFHNIQNLNENSLESQNLYPTESHVRHNNTSNRMKPVDKTCPVPISQYVKRIICQEDFSTNHRGLPNSQHEKSSSLRSQNDSANIVELNYTNQYALKPSVSQNSSLKGCNVLSLDSNNTTEKVEPVNKKLKVPTFQNSSDTEILFNDLSVNIQKHSVISEHQKYPVKRKKLESSDCNSEKTFMLKQFSDFTLNKPIEKMKRATILLSGPSMPTKWKKSSIINRPSLSKKQKGIPPETLIPANITLGLKKKCFSPFKKPYTSIRDSKRNIKPIDSKMTYAAPIRIRGRTSKSKVFFKNSCSRLINNNIDSNYDINKSSENNLMPHECDEKIETYITVQPSKIRKQHRRPALDKTHVCEKIKENKKKTTVSFANAKSKTSMNFISFIKGKDLKDESIELGSSLKPSSDSNENNVVENVNELNIDNSIKCLNRKKEFFTFKKRSLNSNIESATKKQKCSENSEETMANSHNSKSISTLNGKLFADDSSTNKKIEDDWNFEDESDPELIIDEDYNKTSGTYDNSINEFFQKTPEKLSNVKSSCPDLHKESYNSLKNSCNVNFKNRILPNINETNLNNLQLASKNQSDSAEILSNKFKSPSLDEISFESKISNFSTTYSVTDCSAQNNVSVTTAATSNISTTFNSLCKSSVTLECSKQLTKNDKKRFMNKNKQKFLHKKAGCKDSKNEDLISSSVHICEILDGINNTLIDSLVFRKYVHSLTNLLINPKNAPDTASLIFLVMHYLHVKQENPYLKFLQSPESFPFFLPSEHCVVTTLLNVEKKNKLHLQGLINSLLSVMYCLILEKRKLSVGSLASWCRVFTELCKQHGDKLKPLSLCCDLLKQKHRNASLLVASIVGVWKELFEIPDHFLDEQKILFSSIAYGVQKRAKKVTKSTWENISKLISKYFIVPVISDAKQVIESLKEQIVLKSLKSSFENSWYLTSSLVILAAREPWNWTKETLLNDYIVTNLEQFSCQSLNEHAFELFCDLYVDVYLLAPTKFADTVLIKFIEDEVECKEKLFVKNCAAAALMKYVILAKREIPASLAAFLKKNSEHPKIKLLENMVRRRIVSNNVDKLSIEDVRISTK
ncbi:uncharacterized protein LOC129968332 [Argiope bruennichi]|uniref:uncharacterized protein LOC129968332 n=1 Tax=Argiope bruennichi TaxID=94029 RepID=UPI002493D0BE|nr:uncharacterized protein LOC129968332 [Argiope bruennichi]